MVRHHVMRLAVAAGLVALIATAFGTVSASGHRDAHPDVTARRADPVRLRTGDLIFRVGRGWRADAVRWLGDDELSHVGIVDMAMDGPHVIHAAPPEGARPGRVERDTLAVFEDDAASDGVMVYRRTDVDGSTNAAITATARDFARRQIPFDDAFDLRDARAMYCTEMVWRASAAAKAGFRPVLTSIDVGMFKGRYMTPHDLIKALALRRVD